MIIDTHAHLMFPEFDEDREAVIARARAAGLEKIVNVGCGAASSELSLKMAKEDRAARKEGFALGDFLYATLGLHPYDALDISEELLAKWEKWISEDREKIVAIGETGLDYFKGQVDNEKQKLSFRKHLELAVKVDLPVIVHNRGADEDSLNLLQEFKGVRAVFHCYGSTLEFARRVWAAGFMTSFTGIVTYPSAKELREVVKEVPLNQFMVETDCPYLAPQSYRGKRNEPAYVVETLKMIAEMKGMDLSAIELAAAENSRRFFAI